MSSKTKKIGKDVLKRRVHTTVQVLTILENVAQKKNIWTRQRIAFRYVFFKDFKGFFEE